jgi:RNA polymerase sigma-70 factor (ECF subfamily)
MPRSGAEAGAGSLASPDDAGLVARIVAGDETALGRVFDRYGGLVFGLARRVTRSAAAAEEITQEVFVAFWEHPDRFDATRGSLRAYLGSIAHRRAVDVVRRETRRTAREDRVAADPAAPERVVATDAADRAVADDAAARVRAAVAELPADQRRAIELAYFDGFTFREVAARLGIPEGTAKSRLRLALAKLANLLGPEMVVT